MDIVLFGIQGSGKGTQARKLAEAEGYKIFEAGAELRKIAGSGSELGQTIKSIIDAGHLVPFEVIMQVVSDAVCSLPRDQVVIFDGIPRDSEQMREFNAMMERCGREFRCLHFVLPAEHGVTRIAGRAKEQGRADDANEESIRRRMALFQEKTMPVVEEYRASGKVWDIDASKPVEDVFMDVKGVLGLN